MDDAPTLRKGTLGTADIAFFVVSAAAPLTVMAGVAPIAILLGGIGAPVGYLLAGITLAVFAVGFTTMSRHVRGGGAFYAYITRGLGRPVGIAAALLAMLGYNGMEIGIYGLLGSATADTAQALWGIDIPWLPVSLAGLLLIWYGGFRSIDFGAKVLGVLLIAETGILLLLAGGVLLDGGATGLSLASFAPDRVLVPGMAAVLACAFAAFTGFESTVIYRREARRPDRSVPRATYIAVAFLGLFYSFIVWTAIQAFGDEKVVQAATDDPGGLFFSAITHYVGGWAADLMHVLIVTSVLASLLAFHNAINRYGRRPAGHRDRAGHLPRGAVLRSLRRREPGAGLTGARGLPDRPRARVPAAPHPARGVRALRGRAPGPGSGPAGRRTPVSGTGHGRPRLPHHRLKEFHRARSRPLPHRGPRPHPRPGPARGHRRRGEGRADRRRRRRGRAARLARPRHRAHRPRRGHPHPRPGRRAQPPRPGPGDGHRRRPLRRPRPRPAAGRTRRAPATGLPGSGSGSGSRDGAGSGAGRVR